MPAEFTFGDGDWFSWEPRLRGFAEQRLRCYGVPSGRLNADDVVQHT